MSMMSQLINAKCKVCGGKLYFNTPHGGVIKSYCVVCDKWFARNKDFTIGEETTAHPMFAGKEKTMVADIEK